MDNALTFRRYQPITITDEELMIKSLDDFDHLEIGVINPHLELPSNTEGLNSKLIKRINLTRSQDNNPFNYIQRESMICSSLQRAGISTDRFSIKGMLLKYDSPHWDLYLPSIENTAVIIGANEPYREMKEKTFGKKGLGYDIRIYDLKTDVKASDFLKEWPSGSWGDLVPVGARDILENIMFP